MALKNIGHIGIAEAEYKVGPITVIADIILHQLRTPEINLTTAAKADQVDLRARVPTRLTLKGPADLTFQSFVLHLAGLPLVRNLNRTEYQTVVGHRTENEMEFRLAETAYVDEVKILASGSYTVTVVDAAARDRAVRPQGSQTYPVGMPVSIVRVNPPPPQNLVAIQSPSSASQVLITLEDGTPLQAFPAVFDSARKVEAVSRELAEQLNRAWASSGGALDLLLTAQSDGKLLVTAEGAWRRSALRLRPTPGPGQSPVESQPEVSLEVNPLEPLLLEVPLASGWKKANLTLKADGTCSGGLITRMGPPLHSRRFSVRVTESLHVAQGFRLYSGTEPPPSQRLTGAWLCLPAVPEAPEELELRLTVMSEEGQPESQAIAAWPVSLPVDAALYLKTEAGYWFRAACPKPVELDGTALARRLALVAVGQGTGTLLCHQKHPSGLTMPEDMPWRRLEGSSMVVNLAVGRSWEPQRFDGTDALWRFELEFSAGDEPAAPLLAATAQRGSPAGWLPPAAVRLEPGLALNGASLSWQNLTPVANTLQLSLQARAAGSLKLTVLAEEV